MVGSMQTLDDVIDVAVLAAIPQQPQVQCSTKDQLRAAKVICAKFGLYDAADLIQRLIDK
jgi:hypothetical protein